MVPASLAAAPVASTLVLAFAAAQTPTPSPVICKGCLKPSWSWDTVGHMAFTHTCNESGPWSEEALDVISRFPLFNHERFMGNRERCFRLCGVAMADRTDPCMRNCWPEEGPVGRTNWSTGLYADDHLVAACKQLKARNPRLACIFYHDSERMWTNDQAFDMPGSGRFLPPGAWPRRAWPAGGRSYNWNPTVFRGDDMIIREHPSWALHNSTGSFSVNGYAHNHVFDHRTPASKVWVDACLNATSSGAVDGCFADAAPYGTMAQCHDSALGVNCGAAKIAEEYGLTNTSGQAWVKAKEQSLWTLTTALGRGTLISNGNGQDGNTFTNGYMIEGYTPGSSLGTRHFPTNQPGELDVVQAHAHADYDVRNSLVSFLLHARPMGFFSGPDSWAIEQKPGSLASETGLDDVVRRWPPEFDKPLGPPTTNMTCTNATRSGSPSICTRRFASGTKVIWNGTAGQGTIKWADGNVTQGPPCHPEKHTWPGDTNRDRMCMKCKPPSVTNPAPYTECYNCDLPEGTKCTPSKGGKGHMSRCMCNSCWIVDKDGNPDPNGKSNCTLAAAEAGL